MKGIYHTVINTEIRDFAITNVISSFLVQLIPYLFISSYVDLKYNHGTYLVYFIFFSFNIMTFNFGILALLFEYGQIDLKNNQKLNTLIDSFVLYLYIFIRIGKYITNLFKPLGRLYERLL